MKAYQLVRTWYARRTPGGSTPVGGSPLVRPGTAIEGEKN